MPRLHYNAQGFPPGSPSGLSGWHYFRPTWNDIVWAAVSVGKNGLFDLFAYGPFSLDEIRFRAYMVWACLQQQGSSEVARSSAYDGLDPSEKGAVSFFLGMAFAKLAAEFLLDVPWLIHLEKLRRIHPVILAGRSRPDLAGRTASGDWVVVEAKGRTNSYSQAVMGTAKTQSRQLLSIDGIAPTLRVASQAYFSPLLEMRVRDPNPDDKGYDLDITLSQFLGLYYEPFTRIPDQLTRIQHIEDQPYVFMDYKDLEVSIGIHKDLEAAVPEHAEDIAQFRFERRVFHTAGDHRGTVSLYRDGLAVQLGAKWSEDSMQLPPENR